MWLINPDEILKKMESVFDMQDVYLPIHFMEFVIDEMPMIDAEPVLRCKDCKYWIDEAGTNKTAEGVTFARCQLHNYLIDGRHTGWCPTENDYCSVGERKGR